MKDNLAHALHYIKKGLSIIPIGSNKRPVVSWKEFQTKIASEEQIKEWFTNTDYQIGIVTGKISNLTVIDVEKGGSIKEYPQTLTSKTGGEGYHLYYRYTTKVRNIARVKELTDIRNDGGYVVAPPSTLEKGSYLWLNNNPIVDFPDEMFEENNFKKEKREEYTIPEYNPVNQGQRNDSILRYTGSVIPRVHPLDWETIAWPIIQKANQKNSPPLTETEIRSIFDNICEHEKLNPTRISSPKKETNVDAIMEELQKDDIMPIYQIADGQKSDDSHKYSTSFNKFDTTLRGGFKDGDLVVLTGPSGNGKTLFAQTLTYNFAEQGYPVLFFSYEVMIRELWDKFLEMGVSKDHLIFSPYRTITGKVSWIDKKVDEAINKYGTKIIVIDHLGFLLPDEKKYNPSVSSNQDAFLTSICRHLKTLAISREIVIILLVHLKKTEKPTIKDIKGSSGIEQESDTVFLVQRVLAKNWQEAQESESMYVETDTHITLGKNRLNGNTPTILCHMSKGRLIEKYNIK